MELVSLVMDLLANPRWSRWLCPFILLADAVLCAAIIEKVPYTEIDWKTYMQQVSLFLAGERDYLLLKGDTGPLVYPAAHVYIYALLHRVTDDGFNINSAQWIFAAIYLTSLSLVMICYCKAGAPPYLLPLLVLSKRLHSIFLLRLFNDGIATLFLWAALAMLQRRHWLPAVVLWSVGVGVKMTLLLVAPGLSILLLLNTGLAKSVGLGITAILIQFLLGAPFLGANATGYVSKAFELTRVFLYKWTVNWRFVGEDTFLSKQFSTTLLMTHVSLLLLFIASQWTRSTNKGIAELISNLFHGNRRPAPTSSSRTTAIILSSLVVGLLCARTLHYQFFAYIAWATPLILWSSSFNPILIFVVCGLQEWAWNVFPSTPLSSAVVVGCLAIQVFGALARIAD